MTPVGTFRKKQSAERYRLACSTFAKQSPIALRANTVTPTLAKLSEEAAKLRAEREFAEKSLGDDGNVRDSAVTVVSGSTLGDDMERFTVNTQTPKRPRAPSHNIRSVAAKAAARTSPLSSPGSSFPASPAVVRGSPRSSSTGLILAANNVSEVESVPGRKTAAGAVL